MATEGALSAGARRFAVLASRSFKSSRQMCAIDPMETVKQLDAASLVVNPSSNGCHEIPRFMRHYHVTVIEGVCIGSALRAKLKPRHWDRRQ